ncbi:hypothetical protein SIN8267_00620 [Sinobacterium norvegicum]|uniref:Glutamine cyclotransferase n=1 Tax=Sinobacterium norvegicum TaxID=1641715 RepID=A0ABN8EDI8_9GAMM|nr:glutaminyl-peptide cyclotransferase [Sinobacterium norvegicum]CAH0990528.1 hypothetical protein SIN8267_00620 [Sinobacterium norvegicum]
MTTVATALCRLFKPALLAGMLLLVSQASLADWRRVIVTDNLTLTPLARINKNHGFFTQGLTVDNNVFFESNGQYGQSTLCRSKILNQNLTQPQCHSIRADFFAEGITIINDSVFQLTWRENTLIEYHKKTLEPIKSYHYSGQGWGLTNNKRYFIMSDGSSSIQLRNLATFNTERTLPIRHNDKPLSKINELEWINNRLWANQWHSDSIFLIDLSNGQVDEVIDFSHLLATKLRPHSQAVLNGIAFDKANNQLYITGKHWPYYYLYQLTEH